MTTARDLCSTTLKVEPDSDAGQKLLGVDIPVITRPWYDYPERNFERALRCPGAFIVQIVPSADHDLHAGRLFYVLLQQRRDTCSQLGPAQIFKWAKLLARGEEQNSLIDEALPSRVKEHHPDDYSDEDKAPFNRSKHPPPSAAVPLHAGGKRPAPEEVGDPLPKGSSLAWKAGPSAVQAAPKTPRDSDVDQDAWITHSFKVRFFFFFQRSVLCVLTLYVHRCQHNILKLPISSSRRLLLRDLRPRLQRNQHSFMYQCQLIMSVHSMVSWRTRPRIQATSMPRHLFSRIRTPGFPLTLQYGFLFI